MTSRRVLLLSSIFGSRSFCLASRLQLPKLPSLDRAVCARRVQVQVSALVQLRSHGRWAGGRPAPLGPAGLSRQGVCSLFLGCLSRSFCLASRLQLPKLPCLDRAVCARRVQLQVSALGPAAQPWSLAGGRAAGSFRTGGSFSSRCATATASQHSCHRRCRCNGKPAQLPLPPPPPQLQATQLPPPPPPPQLQTSTAASQHSCHHRRRRRNCKPAQLQPQLQASTAAAAATATAREQS